MKLKALYSGLATPLAALSMAGALPVTFMPTASAAIVNLGANLGFTYNGGGSDPAPVAGEHLNFIGPVPTLALAAGTYTITNATGLPGANPNYTAWSYNLYTSSWTWAFVIATAAGSAIGFEKAGDGNSQSAVAALASVQNFSTNFTLAAPTVVAFTLRDYYVPDNGGGIALDVEPAAGAVPEPATWAMMLGGFGTIGAAVRRRRISVRFA